jgi:pyrroline-5-carboxylate reductase
MTDPTRVAVIGAGRLARALVGTLPDDVDVVVVARRAPSSPLPRASLTVVERTSEIDSVGVVIPAVPGEQVTTVLEEVDAVVAEGTVVFNVATDLPTRDLAERFPRLRVVATKVVGQAGELERGFLGAVAVDHADAEQLVLARRLLGGLGPVVRLDERQVLAANTAVGEEMARAVVRCRATLEALRLPPEVVDAALGTMAVGALRAIATGTAGPFLRRIVERVGTTA